MNASSAIVAQRATELAERHVRRAAGERAHGQRIGTPRSSPDPPRGDLPRLTRRRGCGAGRHDDLGLGQQLERLVAWCTPICRTRLPKTSMRSERSSGSGVDATPPPPRPPAAPSVAAAGRRRCSRRPSAARTRRTCGATRGTATGSGAPASCGSAPADDHRVDRRREPRLDDERAELVDRVVTASRDADRARRRRRRCRRAARPPRGPRSSRSPRRGRRAGRTRRQDERGLSSSWSSRWVAGAELDVAAVVPAVGDEALVGGEQHLERRPLDEVGLGESVTSAMSARRHVVRHRPGDRDRRGQARVDEAEHDRANARSGDRGRRTATPGRAPCSRPTAR